MKLIILVAAICFANADLDKRLGEKCTHDSECLNNWASCIGDGDLKVCACMDGFTKDINGLCQPLALFCPGFIIQGDVLVNQAPNGPCDAGYRFDDNGNRIIIDSNCTGSDFCFIHSTSVTKEGLLFGHCCPRLPPGNTGKMATACPTVPSPGFKCRTASDPGTCPALTHHCYDDIPNSDLKACCPKACQDELLNNQFDIEGTGNCFVKKTYGDKCLYTAECPDDAKCLKNMTNDDFSCISTAKPAGP